MMTLTLMKMMMLRILDSTLHPMPHPHAALPRIKPKFTLQHPPFPRASVEAPECVIRPLASPVPRRIQMEMKNGHQNKHGLVVGHYSPRYTRPIARTGAQVSCPTCLRTHSDHGQLRHHSRVNLPQCASASGPTTKLPLLIGQPENVTQHVGDVTLPKTLVRTSTYSHCDASDRTDSDSGFTSDALSYQS